ncbi:HAMP domain-containing protein [Stakelama sp. CBK3Z-3]|uniref:histidine kinase n=2 Tax=Stakelama flava TaxID=2860338 RepID=A0ABS6XK11_9SPHN|nr:ATP-binding protein [Stakelama flava]MBW4330549.1 HAMP domain-containing protein [Stakelama flava]
MLLALLLVQIFNFALVVLVPPPQPDITSLATVVEALEQKPSETLRISYDHPPSKKMAGPHERRIAKILANRLGIPANQVNVDTHFPAPHGAPMAMFGREGPVQRERMDSLPRPEAVLFGDFTVSARMDNRWITVKPKENAMAPWRRRALLWLLVAIVVVAPVAWILARALARPIRLFAQAAERLGRDPKAPPLALSGPPEIGEAAAAFNEMQSRLNRYVEDRTTLMAAIAHDLRTPLMRLGLRLENAPGDLRTACEEDIRDMEEMVAAVMAFVRDMRRPSRRQRLDLQALAQSVTDGFEDAGGAVTLEPGEPVVVEGDAASLKAMLSNLVGNALKYADGATVSLITQGANAVIEVRDCGPGMEPDDLERAFEPFFRGERSRNRNTGGIGLGLASARAVARGHGGDIVLANRPEGGLIATATLPL